MQARYEFPSSLSLLFPSVFYFTPNMLFADSSGEDVDSNCAWCDVSGGGRLPLSSCYQSAAASGCNNPTYIGGSTTSPCPGGTCQQKFPTADNADCTGCINDANCTYCDSPAQSKCLNVTSGLCTYRQGSALGSPLQCPSSTTGSPATTGVATTTGVDQTTGTPRLPPPNTVTDSAAAALSAIGAAGLAAAVLAAL
jgi:hypothetical protein